MRLIKFSVINHFNSSIQKAMQLYDILLVVTSWANESILGQCLGVTKRILVDFFTVVHLFIEKLLNKMVAHLKHHRPQYSIFSLIFFFFYFFNAEFFTDYFLSYTSDWSIGTQL